MSKRQAESEKPFVEEIFISNSIGYKNPTGLTGEKNKILKYLFTERMITFNSLVWFNLKFFALFQLESLKSSILLSSFPNAANMKSCDDVLFWLPNQKFYVSSHNRPKKIGFVSCVCGAMLFMSQNLIVTI
jgi:hypothetical protein